MGCAVSSEQQKLFPPLPRNCTLETWFDWKRQALYIADSKEMKANPFTLGKCLKDDIGPYGLEIIDNFRSDNDLDLNNFFFLMSKLDIFFHLRTIARKPNEDIQEFHKRLTVEAKSIGSNYPAQNAIENIIYDLNKINFLSTILGKLISVRNDITDLKKLNIEEVMFLVNAYDNREIIPRQMSLLQENGGKRIINDCNYCGISHLEYECGAFRQKCSKCKRNNHFYWKCQWERLPSRIIIHRHVRTRY